MELANCMVALADDRNNTVPKWGVTAAEIAVLLAIHGPKAVFDIEPAGQTARSMGEEIERLRFAYPARDEDRKLVIDTVYAGARPVLHTTIEQLGLASDHFKATSRADTSEAPAKPKKTKKVEEAAPPPPVATVAAADPNDATNLFDDE